MDTKHVLWSLTINNPTLEENDLENGLLYGSSFKDIAIIRMLIRLDTLAFAVIGRENWKSNKTPHFQIGLAFAKPVKFSRMKEIFPRAHIKTVDYPFQVLINYCMKDMEYVELGNKARSLRLETAYRKSLIDISQSTLDKQIQSYYNKLGGKGVSL